MSRLDDMFAALAGARHEVLPSKYWEELNKENVRQLETQGYGMFKRTLALNYFTFLVSRKDVQLEFLQTHLPFSVRALRALASVWKWRHPGLSWKQSLLYTFHTLLLWEYTQRSVPAGIMDRLSEPQEGGPFDIRYGKKLVSQDLANSVLEFHSIMAPPVRLSEVTRILELGAGYGRTAYVFLTLIPGLRYIVVDIPPALYVSERYLSSQFPDKRVFRFRPFTSFADVRAEFEQAELAFLLPHQLELLPDDCVDLFINISSLHEMRMDQIRYYFDVIDRLTVRYFYTKQWKISTIPYENVEIHEDDYPVKPVWRELFHRDCNVQTNFFEAMYHV